MERIVLICFYLLGAVACLLQGIYSFSRHARYTQKAKQKGKKFGKIFVSIGLTYLCLSFAGVSFSLRFLLMMDDLGYLGYSFIFLAIILSFSSADASKNYLVHKSGKKEENK